MSPKRSRYVFGGLFVLLGLTVLAYHLRRGAALGAAHQQINRLLEDSVFGTRAEQDAALGELGRTAELAIPYLMETLSKVDEGNFHRELRWLAVKSPSRFLQKLRPYLKQPDLPTWREYAAVRALGRIGPPASKSLPLLKRLSKAGGSFGITARAALMRVRKEGIEDALKELKDPSAPSWVTGAWLVGEFGSNSISAVPMLCSRLPHVNSEDASIVAEALGRIGGEAQLVVPALLARLRQPDTHPDEFFWALGQFEGASREAVPLLQQWLKENYSGAKSRSWAAALTIWKILPPNEAAELVPTTQLAHMLECNNSFGDLQTYYILKRADPRRAATRGLPIDR